MYVPVSPSIATPALVSTPRRETLLGFDRRREGVTSGLSVVPGVALPSFDS